jgi:transcriptional regulator with XRE-family HTH domain
MTVLAVEAEAGCAPSTISRLERGLVRPRPSMLAAIAEVPSPDDPDGLAAALCAAAGPSWRPDAAGGVRARRRRSRRVRLRRYRWATSAQKLENEAVVGYAVALGTSTCLM